MEDYARGQQITGPDFLPEHAFVVEWGLVRLYRLTAAGAETTLHLAAPGEIFGSLPGLLGMREEPCFAVALRPSGLFRIPVADLEQRAVERPELLLILTRQIARRLRRIESRLESIAVCDARRRFVQCLLQLAEDFGRPAREGVALDAFLTQEELATLVGTTRQTVNATVGQLRAQGLLLDRVGSMWLDVEGLRAVAEGRAEPAPGRRETRSRGSTR
jgi:CRP/FNR family cyclic AMP-dependent transcriptional regulator